MLLVFYDFCFGKRTKLLLLEAWVGMQCCNFTLISTNPHAHTLATIAGALPLPECDSQQPGHALPLHLLHGPGAAAPGGARGGRGEV